ncbi:MAG: hypothetical protein KGI79_01115 [Patescibacteria group bacterium]|nr:hypothetical protein [Patescibacteria group bacterium]MDE2116457.1 hypothetical protein [Patescibacteria group bacterium]
MAEQSQMQAFKAAKDRLSSHVDTDMLAWDFPTLIEKLEEAIQAVRMPGDKNPVRTFTRRRLGMSGETTVKTVYKWIRGQAEIPVEEIMRVFQTLQEIRHEPPQRTAEAPIRAKVAGQPAATMNKAATRKLIGFAIVSFNSLAEMFPAVGVKPTDVNDGDRMEVRRVLKEICSHLGVPVAFPADGKEYPPVTQVDLNKII